MKEIKTTGLVLLWLQMPEFFHSRMAEKKVNKVMLAS